jgi:bifunctional NMN adenylyltransferase/nudix hydrolase
MINKNTEQLDVAVLIGRFQPFHFGHAALLKLALESAPQVVIVIGSSFHARSPKNPFTWQERASMIAGTLSETDHERISFIPVRDYYEDAVWAKAVCQRVEGLSKDGQRQTVGLVGHFKDVSSQYLNLFPQWKLIVAQKDYDIDATRVRKILFEAEDIDVSLNVIAELVPTAIRQYLKGWMVLPHYAPLVDEHNAVEAYKTRWKSAPYTPIFSTLDAVVKTAEHVLLIQRASHPGKGLWAVPGGFLEPRERLLQGAIRELIEETQLGVLTSTLNAAFVDVKVFDHPDRSLRGRTLTHAHFFDLKTHSLPSVSAADDAAHAVWVPISKIAAMEEQFFDDHFHILNYFLKLTDD